MSEHIISKRLASEFGRITQEFRHRKALTLKKTAQKSGVPISRIERYEAGLDAPCFSEMLTLAKAYGVRASMIAGPLQRLCDRLMTEYPGSAALQATFGVTGVTESDAVIAERVVLMQRLSQTKDCIIDITLADWPAFLPPGFPESIQAERAVLRIGQRAIEACRTSPAPRSGSGCAERVPPNKVIAKIGDVLAALHFLLTGVRDRLGQLAVRHSRAMNQHHPTSYHSSPARAPKMSSDNRSGPDNNAGTGTEGCNGPQAALTPEQRIEPQRMQIAKAMSIIEACRLGGDSMLAPIKRGRAKGDDNDDDGGGDGERDTVHFEGALCAANDILDDVLAGLETIAQAVP